ncbi:hypothetical protein ACHAPJ_013287 [Fusarium lateritium]
MGKCIIIGTIQYGASIKIDVLRGSWTAETLIDKAPRQAPIPAGFQCSLELIEPLGKGDDVPNVPWGFFGDIEWHIETEAEPVQKLFAPEKSRLEMYQLPGIAVGGPTEGGDPLATVPDFQGKWPVNLLRLFMPNPSDLTGQTAKIQANILSWWGELTFSKVLALGAQYDALEGRSGYGVGLLGGSLDINECYDKISPTINSFDIGALAEAAYNILKPTFSAAKTPRIDWVGVTPVGGIADKTTCAMVPIGWKGDAATANGVSTPFFKGVLAQSEAAGRLMATAWLEIQTEPANSSPATAFVVQAAFETKGKNDAQWAPDTANIVRDDFFKRHFKDSQSLMQHNEYFLYAVPTLTRTAEDSSSTISPVLDADPVGNDLYRKAGLYNLRGVNEPWPWRHRGIKPSILPSAPSLRVLIGSILNTKDKKNSTNPTGSSGVINAGSLRPSRIYPLLKAQLNGQPNKYDGAADYFRLVVGRGVSVATYVVPLDQNGAIPDVKVRVKISTLESFSDAIEALIAELNGFESDLEKLVLTNDPQKTYGDYMIQTKQSLLFVRNNLLVDISILGLSSYGNPAASDALLALARVLDTYLSASGNMGCQARRSAFTIATTPDDNVIVDTSFSIVLGNVDWLTEETSISISAGQSTVEQPIISTSVGPLVVDNQHKRSTRKLKFFVLQKDLDDLSLVVDIYISGAHYDTFYPCTKATRVTIQ